MQASNQLGLKSIFDCATIRKPKLFKEHRKSTGTIHSSIIFGLKRDTEFVVMFIHVQDSIITEIKSHFKSI